MIFLISKAASTLAHKAPRGSGTHQLDDTSNQDAQINRTVATSPGRIYARNYLIDGIGKHSLQTRGLMIFLVSKAASTLAHQAPRDSEKHQEHISLMIHPARKSISTAQWQHRLEEYRQASYGASTFHIHLIIKNSK